jgi:SAM-dependent methyltransferase
MRPGLEPVHGRLEEARADLGGRLDALRDELRARFDGARADRLKYDSELEYWRYLVKRGGSEKDFGRPFEDIFGHWVRQRIVKLGHFLGLPPVGEPGDVDDWAAARSVVEIGAGPFPSVAGARKGWLRCVAVDPIARGYVEEGLVASAARHVVYIEAPGERVPLPAGFADLVVIENCLDHVGDPGAVVREIARLLRPGGHVWIFVDLSNHVDHMHPHAMNERKVRALFGGFDVVRDEVSTHKAHPEAYGSYRGLLRKRDGARRDAGVAAPAAVDAGRRHEEIESPGAQGVRGAGDNGHADVTVTAGLSLNGSVAGRHHN